MQEILVLVYKVYEFRYYCLTLLSVVFLSEIFLDGFLIAESCGNISLIFNTLHYIAEILIRKNLRVF